MAVKAEAVPVLVVSLSLQICISFLFTVDGADDLLAAVWGEVVVTDSTFSNVH